MGCGQSVDSGTKAEYGNSNNIDKNINIRRQDEARKIKMLLLGAGESGKSTIFKQMRILHGAPRSEDDLRKFGVVVRANTLVAIRRLLMHMRNLGLESKVVKEKSSGDMSVKEAYEILCEKLIDKPRSAVLAEELNKDEKDTNDWVTEVRPPGIGENVFGDCLLFLKLVDEIRILWKSETMKEVWLDRAKANIIDSHKVYLDDLTRISSPEFRPTNKDILLARIRTTQISTEKYTIEGTPFEIVDVGGQRSERRKWIDCFDEVDAVIFVAALSEYDQNLAEQKRTNRMVEALTLFESVVNNSTFSNTSIMLFLNKKDLFEAKIMTSDIAEQKPFSDFCGPSGDYDSGIQYFIDKFNECRESDSIEEGFIHVTCATDTNNMKKILSETQQIIMRQNLNSSLGYV